MSKYRITYSGSGHPIEISDATSYERKTIEVDGSEVLIGVDFQKDDLSLDEHNIIAGDMSYILEEYQAGEWIVIDKHIYNINN